MIVLGSLGGQSYTDVSGARLRAGTSVAFVVDGAVYLVDCGLGSLARLLEAGLTPADVRAVLVTHHHADHTADLGALLVHAWSAGRRPEVRVHGPAPTASWVRALPDVHRVATDRAVAHATRPAFSAFVRAEEFATGGDAAVVLRDDRVEVRALTVDHGGLPSVAYRVRTADRDVVLSGDTGGKTDLAGFAAGADTLMHEVIDFPLAERVLRAQGAAEEFIGHQRDDHSPPEVCGATATRAGVRTLVLYHLIPGTPGVTDTAWRAKVAPSFAGRVLVARDLLEV
ncbi:MBL fold metallo-hydrolase [Svornostia abyssi]|uniref:MBL fold metallo-hydrolase n=1 Tax=Svornostia abyssi TaxID=2898438 RepID=A0ABY5PAP9_9ACTN|nr:MBL fold metallo-hydrolase [Parviterribacteraceae bacterium J379]